MKSQRFVNGGSVMTLKNVTLTQSDSWVVKQNRYSLIRSNHPSSTSWMTTYTTVSLTCEYFKLLLSLDTLILFLKKRTFVKRIVSLLLLSKYF